MTHLLCTAHLLVWMYECLMKVYLSSIEMTTFFKMTQRPQQISLLLMIACTWGLEFPLTTWWRLIAGGGYYIFWASSACFKQWLIKAWWPYQYFSCQIKILCPQIFLATYMICGWKCLVDKDRYWETENSCYRNPVLLQRSYWKISYYSQQNNYPWDQLNILGKSVIEGTMKSIYSQKWANGSPRAARRGRWDIFWKMKI